MKAIERLKQYIDYKGFNNSSFERFNNLSNGYITTQIKRNADLGEGILKKILDNCHDLSSEWLLLGKGNMLIEDTIKQRNTIENEFSSSKENEKGFYNQVAWKACIDKANELYEIKEAILKVLNMTKVGREINISQNEVDVLNNFQELGFDKLMKLSFHGLLKKDTEYETFDYVQLLQEINMNIEIANKMLLNYIDDAQYAVFNDEDKRPYLIYPENFLHDGE